MIAFIGAVAIVGLMMLVGVLNTNCFFRALPLILLLCALSFVAAKVAKVTLGPDWTVWVGTGAPAALLLWAAWRPGSSSAKLWIMSGASFAMNSLKWLAVIACGLTLPANGFHLDVWLTRGWPWAALAVAAWAVQVLVDRVTIWSIAWEPDAAGRVETL
ncbi:hypothetical protein SAMN05216382_1096 [Sphingomonas palmae]|uniref:Uncharacterized protein n=1 Tax=Sphingomonas palmae TaxID=1855283 RepID=A0A1H7KWM7_9SPHN|nr:hypothetical protein [Sphingomonas palmae]SEK91253.1 hypothetical protein SAMN05216382_1096 [Sphingomonas palmae]